MVKQGTLLVQLDDQTSAILLEQAKANYLSAQAKTGDVKAGSRPQQIAQAKDQVKALSASLLGAEQALKRAQQQLQRIKQLAEAGGATPDQLEAAVTAEAAAQANVSSIKSQIRAAQEQVKLLEAGATSFSVSASTAQLEVARQQVNLAKLQLDKYKLQAPVPGRIEQIVLKLGELANPGTTVLKLIDDSQLHVTIYIPQSQLDLVKVGQKLVVKAENSQSQAPGKIVFISSKGEFTPKNIQTQEQRATQVFAVKVNLEPQKEATFKPGQAVEVYLD